MLLAAGFTICLLGMAVLMLAIWQARPAARWTAARQEALADLVRRGQYKERLTPVIEVAVAEVAKTVAPAHRVTTRPSAGRRLVHPGP